ncbi:hypothetical protein TBLA_0B02630 [Henningerozyma blattae CBS 6284]|uniref:Anoctamin transmembrane domain-containing protein n=1 Tax=Henningerozyma blattae (strain ATCC 34711 / CBS 6284 / DSM 70876 / NBRC 10599 / NRRL Y-10934 / UCD 77-7) TaxID=1071380 RepID=I2GYA3_HENB6|nr:hypothetical protein TBLA_0B02630 [Tetrapisispora blattae CBS 6284]CCH59105.1 hypothetical protein TBLA_0B02630 [Tetrapisispora blattae CBS 6284]
MRSTSTIKQFEPNYVISLQYSKQNVSNFVTALGSKGLRAISRPSLNPSNVYILTKINQLNGPDLFEITTQFSNIINSVTPIENNEDKKKLNFLISKKLLSIKNIFTLVDDKDLVELFQLTQNPNLAFYFTFFKTYISWMVPLAVFGIICRLVARPFEFNYIYVLVLVSWTLLFTSNWIFNVKPTHMEKFGNFTLKSNISSTKTPVSVIVKKVAFVPVALGFAAVLLGFQFFCFFLEIFITQLYSGPLVSILALLPTILLSVFVPVLTIIYNIFVNKFVNWENGPNPSNSKVEKNLVLTFMTSYVPLLITLFFYLPFGHYFDSNSKSLVQNTMFSYNLNIPVIENDFKINIDRFRSQFFYFVVTNQIIQLLMNNCLPGVLATVLPKILSKKDTKEVKLQKENVNYIMKTQYSNDFLTWENFSKFESSNWGEFDIDENYKKIFMQFGYLTMFSIIWPLAPVIFLLFNLLNIRLDIWRAFKKCKPTSTLEYSLIKSSIPLTTKPEISLWDIVLEIQTWIGIITSVTITYMYRNCKLPNVGLTNPLEKRDIWYKESPMSHSWTSVLLVAVGAEHLAFLAYYLLATATFSSQSRNSLKKRDQVTPRDISTVNEKELVTTGDDHQRKEPVENLDLSDVIKETIKTMNSILPGSSNSNDDSMESSIDDESYAEYENQKSQRQQQKLNTNIAKDINSATNDVINSIQNEGYERTNVNEGEPLIATNALGNSNVLNDRQQSNSRARDDSVATGIKNYPYSQFNSKNDKQAQEKSSKHRSSTNRSINSNTNNQTRNDTVSTNASSTSSLAAGATVPETIPTSKNYHLRYDKFGNPISAPTSTSSVLAVPKETSSHPLSTVHNANDIVSEATQLADQTSREIKEQIDDISSHKKPTTPTTPMKSTPKTTANSTPKSKASTQAGSKRSTTTKHSNGKHSSTKHSSKEEPKKKKGLFGSLKKKL